MLTGKLSSLRFCCSSLLLLFLFVTVGVTADAQYQPPPDHANALAWTAQRYYQPGNEITVHFRGLPGNNYDWVSIAPVDSTDQTYIRWSYTNGDRSGSMNFAGLDAGEYEVRVYFNWSSGGYTVHSRYPFTIAAQIPATVDVQPGSAETQQPSPSTLAWTRQGHYAPDAEITIDLRGLPGNRYDWISISEMGSSERSYTRWSYTNGVREGTIKFPGVRPGEYEVRVYFNWSEGGYEIQSRHPFVVSGDAIKERDPSQQPAADILAWTARDRYQASEDIDVFFTGLPGNSMDWISLAAADSPDNSYLRWSYTQGERRGEMSFEGLTPGQYEVRVYFNWSAGGYTVHSRFPFVIE